MHACAGTHRQVSDRDALRRGGLLQLDLLLQPRVDHLGARDVLLRVGQVDVQGVLAPGDALVLVGLGVAEARGLPGLTANQPPEVGSWADEAIISNQESTGGDYDWGKRVN